MCGIAGYWDIRQQCSASTLQSFIVPMTQSMYRRGPDSGGVWIDSKACLALGHRRLSIRELSASGNQPMCSSDGRFVLVYNGEIFNTAELLLLLKERGCYPQGTSDTEVLLLCCQEFGTQTTLRQLLGMYAFALWDRHERTLTIARDRFGVKPLYWGMCDNAFVFASTLTPIRALGHLSLEIDRDALCLLLRYGYIPAPHTIFKGIYKLPAAHSLILQKDGHKTLAPYWNPLDVVQKGQDHPLTITDITLKQHVDTLDDILTHAVSRRMVSDVPVGAFLSGGIDSSAVVALMQKNSLEPVRTFSIGFEDAAYNEAPYAAAVAKHLGTEHTEAIMTPQDAFALIPDLPYMYDEPFADSSQLPTALLSRLTRQSVTVALTGDGGDELFAGYGRYTYALKNTPPQTSPSRIRSMCAAFLQMLSPHAWNALNARLPQQWQINNLGERVHNYATLRLTGDALAYYHKYCLMYWWYPQSLVLNGEPQPTLADDATLLTTITDPLARMQYVDSRLYLADDILAKVDRANMYFSLETRVPLLDTCVYEYACCIPAAWRIREDKGKYLLRSVLHKYVPSTLVERPKMGFGIPVGDWLRGPLKGWAEELLSPDRLQQEGYLRAAPLMRAWQRHQDGMSNWQYHLWAVLMFQAWLNATPSYTISNEPVAIVVQ